MAREELTVNPVSITGFSALGGTPGTAGGHSFKNKFGNEVIFLSNVGAAIRNVRVVSSGETAQGLSIGDQDYAVPIAGLTFAGPFQRSSFNVPGTSDVYINYLDGGSESDIETKIVRVETLRI
jgi:hypothetical protein